MSNRASLFIDWLQSSQDYQAGLQLAEQHSTNHQLLDLIRQGNNPFTRRKLREELQHLADTEQLQRDVAEQLATSTCTTPAPPAAVLDAEHVDVVHVDVAEQLKAERLADPELKKLQQERLAGFKRGSYLHSRLTTPATQEERYHAAVEIRQIFRHNQLLWDNEQYFLQYGFFPPTRATAPALDLADHAAVLKRRNTLRTYLAGTGRGDEAKRAAWTAEQLELDRILNHG